MAIIAEEISQIKRFIGGINASNTRPMLSAEPSTSEVAAYKSPIVRRKLHFVPKTIAFHRKILL